MKASRISIPYEHDNQLKDFKIIRTIGTGRFGNVKLVKHKTSKEKYALKIIKRECLDYPEQVYDEVKVFEKLTHVNIVSYKDFFKDEKNYYILMEYIEGLDLFEFIKENKNMEENIICYIFSQILDGVSYMHKKNILHRDIKLENILIDRKLTVKICDFGWSKCTKYRCNEMCGTNEYMAPEMTKKKWYDSKVDIWALGILLHELFHAESPHPVVKNQNELLKNISEGKVYIKKKGLSESALELLVDLLRYNPDKRPTIEEVICHEWIIGNKDFIL